MGRFASVRNVCLFVFVRVLFANAFAQTNPTKYKVPSCSNHTCDPVLFHDEAPCCDTCYSRWQDSIEKLVRSTGGVGLFFSFTVVSVSFCLACIVEDIAVVYRKHIDTL